MNLLSHTLIIINSVLVLGASPPDVCPKSGVAPVFLPDEDCGKFYQCSNGIAYLFNCPAGLHFNDKLNVCDWPASAGCEQRKTTTTPEPTTEVPSTIAVSTTTATTITPVSTTLSTELPTASTEKTTLSTATSSITTHETTSTELPTTVSTEETTLSTTTAVPSTITTQVSTHETTTPSESSSKTTNGSTKVPNNTIETTTALANICSQQPDESFLAPDSTDCTKYLYCNYGTVHIMKCPNGRYFNPAMLICTLPSQAGCHI